MTDDQVLIRPDQLAKRVEAGELRPETDWTPVPRRGVTSVRNRDVTSAMGPALFVGHRRTHDRPRNQQRRTADGGYRRAGALIGNQAFAIASPPGKHPP